MASPWAAPEGAEGTAAPVPLPLPPIAAPRDFDCDKAPSGNDAHVKKRLIKRHFCKTTHIYVIFLRFQI